MNRWILPCLALPLGASAQGVDTTALKSLLDRVVPAAIATAHVPGAVVAIVEGNHPIALRGFGLAQLEDSVPADPERSAYRLASVAKLFVAATVMERVAAGRLALDRPVRDLLGDSILIDPRVTLRHLLTHTSGLDDRIIGYGAPSRAAMRPLAEYLTARLPRGHWPPGTIVSYSNHGMALAGLVAEREASRAYSTLAQEHVFGPLGMSQTWYVAPDDSSLATTIAPGYRCGPGGCERAPEVWSHTYPVGLAWSTARDMSRFLIAFVGDSGARLSEVARREALRRQFTHDDALPGMGLAFFEQVTRGHTVFSHAGGVPGAATVLALVPSRRLGVFIATNAGEPGVTRTVMDSVLAFLLPDETPAPPVASGPVAEYVGAWRLGRFAHETIERFPAVFAYTSRTYARGDTLLMAAGSGTRRFVRTDSLQLQDVRDGSRMVLRRDARGRLTHLFAPVVSGGSELPGGFERVPWYEVPYFLNEYDSALAGIPLLVIAAWGLGAIVRFLVRRRRKVVTVRVDDPARRLTPVLAALQVAVFTLFMFGFVAASSRDLGRAAGITFGFTTADTLLLRLAWLFPVLAVMAIVVTVRAWRHRWWHAFDRCCLTLLAVCGVACTHFVVWWGYLPGRW